tara:strand:+ start:577 stop:861 length:285 start_codon:yes stop_codon:yes gene_type:complete
MKKYQKILVFTLFCYTLFSINWYRNYDTFKIVSIEEDRVLNLVESQEMLNYSSSKTYTEYSSESFKHYKSVIPGIIKIKPFNNRTVRYVSSIKI